MRAAVRGRPAIGPKAQTQIAPELAEWVTAEAERRGVRPAVVYREVLENGIARLRDTA